MIEPEFDRIADVYDETRKELDPRTLDGIKGILEKNGCHSILEIGVGTGRVALPLIRSGFEVTGIDISKMMMKKAIEKGVRSLLLADGSEAPFRERSFEATLMAHVFHLLDDPLSVMREAARVSTVGVFALVRKGTGAGSWSMFYEDDNKDATGANKIDEATRKYFEERRERFRKIYQKYDMDPSDFFRHRRREWEVLQKLPPDELEEVSDVIVSQSLEERISRFEKGGFSSINRMPEQMRREIVEEMRSLNQTVSERVSMRPRHEVYQVALWKSEKLLST